MKNKGFTFVEIIIGVTIFLIVALGAYEGYRVLYASVSAAHIKIVASSLVNERFEIVRNLPYIDVGTVGGTPPGKIFPNQLVVRDGISWDIATTIQNVDDPFDGLAGADSNSKPADYKLVEISVSCATCKNFKTVVVTGRVAPRNLEP